MTRVQVWVIDLDHHSWIEHGDGNAFWLTRLASASKITLIRDRTKRSYIVVSDRDAPTLIINYGGHSRPHRQDRRYRIVWICW
ncbi:MAG: hypothetical protein CM1200mP9_06170 [Gammaproteobacteria bacterium]|nr:MAG: hypothetical protein CM1200mP9_06170 [Gammaproteobacteria bacterium]